MDAKKLKENQIKMKKNLPFSIYVGYGLGHVLNDVCAAIWFSYLLVYFHYVLKFDNNQSGILLLVGQIADAVSTPFIGYHSDKNHNCWLYSFGRRKVWYFIGTACVILTFPFIFSPCLGCENIPRSEQMIYYSCFIIVFQFGWAAVQISHMALIPEITSREHQKTKLASIRSGATVIASVLVYSVTWGILGKNDDKIGPSDVTRFQYIVWSVMCFGCLCSFIFYLLVKEPKVFGNGIEVHEDHHHQQRTNMKELFLNSKVYVVAVVYMSSRLFLNLTQVFISLYLVDCLEMAATALAVIPLVMYIASFLASIPIHAVTKKIGRKLTYILGASLGLIACLFIQWGRGNVYTTYLIYVVVMILGAATTIVLVSSLDTTTDLIGTKTSSGAFIYGIMSFADKLSNGVVVEIIQALRTVDDNENNTNYYKNVMTYACGGSVLLGSIFILFLKNRNDEEVEKGDYNNKSDISTIT